MRRRFDRTGRLLAAAVPALGCYAPAAHAAATSSTGPAVVAGNRWLPYVTAGTVAVVVLAGLPLYLRLRRERHVKGKS